MARMLGLGVVCLWAALLCGCSANDSSTAKPDTKAKEADKTTRDADANAHAAKVKQDETPRSGPGAASTPGQGAAAASKDALPIVDKEAFDKVIEQLHGKVVLVDFWATWCKPCVELIPHTAELYNRHKAEGLAVVMVSLDDPNDPAAVQDFLKAHAPPPGSSFVTLLSKDEQDTFEKFGLENGALPHYLIFDRNGKRVEEISFEPTKDPASQRKASDIDVAVEKALGQTLVQ